MKPVRFLFIILLFLPVFSLAQNPMNVTTNAGGLQWNRLPSDAEIEAAVNDLINRSGGTISVNGDIVDEKRVEVSKVEKYHNEEYAGKREPWLISSAKIYMATYGKYGTTINSFALVQNVQTDKFSFIGTYMGSYRPTSLSEVTKEGNGFAPPLNGNSSSDNSSNGGSDDLSSDEEIPWTVVIGTLSAAAVAAIVRKLLKKGASSLTQKSNQKKDNKKDEKEEEEEAHYVLQINKESFQLRLNEPENLSVLVYKITAKGQKKYPANIRIQNSEKALKILPDTGVGDLNAQLILQKQPEEYSFSIYVNATADGHEFQKTVSVRIFGEKELMIETAPDNKRSIRPDTYQILTCSAQILDENGKNLKELTENIVFKPQSDWIDLSEPVLDDDKLAINIGCTNPNPNNSASKPPHSVTLSAIMDKVGEGEEPLQNDLVITLLDCQLETEISECSFPAVDEMSEITFNAYIENAGDEEGWQFDAQYRKGIDPDEPLTTIEINKKNETEVSIKLTGPILKPSDNQTILSKTLVVSAVQGEEKPLERHINVMVSQVGLYIKHGVEQQNELFFTAEKPFEKNLDFALYRYDEMTNQIKVDEQGLQNLTFELQDEEQEKLNLESVLKPSFTYDTLVTNAPYGRYQFKTEEDIPGFGEVITLNYLVKATVGIKENPESFEQLLKVKVRSYGIGEEFPEWVKAYEQCKTIIRKYVPAGKPNADLTDLLEKRKMTLGAEGLTELRNRIWKVASNLILAEGAEGYKDMETWANRITVTLEWTEWAGDLAFNALAAFYLKGVGATGAGMIKAEMIEALNFYIYEPEKGWDVFADRQYNKIIPLLVNVAKGRLISIENIELVVKNNKVLAWTIFISCEFLFNLYQTKSVVEAAKITAQQLRDEFIMRKLTAKLQQDALKYNLKFTTPDEVLDDLMKSIKTINGEEVVDPKKVLEFMRDPAKIRTIKNHGTEQMKQIFEKSRNKIYEKHDAELKKYISDTYKIDPDNIKIDDFRTPGTDGKTNLNTDRDYRVLRKVKTQSGDVWIELQSPNWKQKSYEIFGEATGKPFGVDSVEWAERHQQRGTDRFDAEACKDYADNTYNPSTGEVNRNQPNIIKVKKGEGRLIDAEGLGKMYKNKVNNALEPGTVPEAYAQAKKGVDTLKKVHDSYGNQGLDVPEIPDKLKKAMDLVEKAKVDADASPEYLENLNKKLNDLDYKDLGEVANDMSKSFNELKKFDQNDPREIIFGW